MSCLRRRKTSKKSYTVSKAYWNKHSHNKYLGYKIISYTAYTVTKRFLKKSKDGKQNIRDSGLANLSNKEVSRRARDKSLSPKERQRYKTEEKARELRNKQKRKSHY